MAASKKQARKRRKIIIFAIELVVILGMVGLLIYVLMGGNNGKNVTTGGGPLYTDTSKLDMEKDLGISAEIQAVAADETQPMYGYMNIAFFGIDALSNKSSDLMKNYRSDSIMICSINMETGDIKICSVYRDTYLNIGEDSYNKCNHAYAKGGATRALNMLNTNLDLNITDFISVSYQGMVDVIDGLGGVYVDVDSAEISHLNNYQISIADVLKCDYTPVTQTGYQKLNGLQATAYCRIRYTAGDDFKRAERQREVLQAIADQAKQSDIATLLKVFDAASADVYTSLSADTITELLKNITKYNIVDNAGFPNSTMRTTGTIGAKGSCVIPVDLESNVVWLHQFLFNDEAYVASETVKNCSAKVKSDTSPYLN